MYRLVPYLSHIATPLFQKTHLSHTIFFGVEPILSHTFYVFSKTIYKPRHFLGGKNDIKHQNEILRNEIHYDEQ